MSSEVAKRPRPDKRQVYVIWTNKGGVGKTTLSFHIATTSAILKQKEGWKVLVCDLCPQANISMTLLTPRKKDRRPSEESAEPDSEAHNEGADNVEKLCHERLRPDFEIYCTVAGYIQSFVSRKAAAKVPPKDFLIQPCKYNEAIPENMYLLCGDPALGVSCERLEQYRRADPGGDGEEPWRESTLALREFVDAACDGVDPDGNWLVIIDTNPALTAYTQLALVAADQIIMPVNADDFSKVAVKALFELLYSTGEEDQRFTLLQKLTFAYKVKEYNVPLPRVRLVVNNRQTIYKTRACGAFSHMGNMIGGTLFDLFKKHPDRFVGGEEILMKLEGRTDAEQRKLFRDACTADLKDFHSTAVVCTHMGVPLSVIAEGNFKKLDAFKSVGRGNGQDCLSSVKKLCMKMLKMPAEESTGANTPQQPRVTKKSVSHTSSAKGKGNTSDPKKNVCSQKKASVKERTPTGTSQQPRVTPVKSGTQTSSAKGKPKTSDPKKKAGGQRKSAKFSLVRSRGNPTSNQQTAALATKNGFQPATLSSSAAATEAALFPIQGQMTLSLTSASHPGDVITSSLQPANLTHDQAMTMDPMKQMSPTGISSLNQYPANLGTTPAKCGHSPTKVSTTMSNVPNASRPQVPEVIVYKSPPLTQLLSHQLTAQLADEGMTKALPASRKRMPSQQRSAKSTPAKYPRASTKGRGSPKKMPEDPYRTTWCVPSTASSPVCTAIQPVPSPNQLYASTTLVPPPRPSPKTSKAASLLAHTSFTSPHSEPSLLEGPPKRPRYNSLSSSE